MRGLGRGRRLAIPWSRAHRPENCTPWSPASAGGPLRPRPPLLLEGSALLALGTSSCVPLPQRHRCSLGGPPNSGQRGQAGKVPRKAGVGSGACMRAPGEACGPGGAPWVRSDRGQSAGTCRVREPGWKVPSRAWQQFRERGLPPGPGSQAHANPEGQRRGCAQQTGFLHAALCPADGSRKSTLDWGSSLGRVVL